LFKNADSYFKKFLEQGYELYISTISVAEFCVKGDTSQLPLRNLRVLPFNIEHAKRAGSFARIIFDKKERTADLERIIIPNDTKLFAQSDTEPQINYYLTSDMRSKRIYDILADAETLNFMFIDLNTSYEDYFLELGFK